MNVIHLVLVVNGLLFDPQLTDGNCSCSSENFKTQCVISDIRGAQKKYRMITLLDAQRNPISGKVRVLCVHEDSGD